MQGTQNKITTSILFFVPRGGRFSHRRLAALLDEIDKAGIAASDVEVLLCGAFDSENLDERAAEMLATLQTQHPRLQVGATALDQSGGELLNAATALARGETIAFMDSRAHVKAGALFMVLRSLTKTSALAAYTPRPEDSAQLEHSTAAGPDFGHLALLMRAPALPGLVVWRKELQQRIGSFDTSLHYWMLPEFLFRIALQAPVLTVNPELGSLPASRLFMDKETRSAHETAMQAEGKHIVAAGIRYFLENELPAYPSGTLARQMTQQAKTAMTLLRTLQNGGSCSENALVQSVFAYSLLALRLGQHHSAREITETTCEIITDKKAQERLEVLLACVQPKMAPAV